VTDVSGSDPVNAGACLNLSEPPPNSGRCDLKGPGCPGAAAAILHKFYQSRPLPSFCWTPWRVNCAFGRPGREICV